jgi:hypothetical protein
MKVRWPRVLATVVLALGVVAAIVLSRGRDERVERVGRPIALALIDEAQAGCGGMPTVKWPGGGTWRCTFSDDFDGPGIDLTKWQVLTTRVTAYHSGVECFVNHRSNVSMGNGLLHLVVRRLAKPFTCQSPAGDYVTRYTSGTVTTGKRFDQTYGRFEVRARFLGARVPGLHGAIWLWPSAQTYGAASGEIDIAERYSRYPDRVIPFVHYVSHGKDPTVTNNDCQVKRPERFHTYAAQWTPAAITVTFDGRVCMSTGWDQAAPLRNPAPFDRPFYVNLTQALGIGTNAFDPRTTPLPASMQVDHVYVWG